MRSDIKMLAIRRKFGIAGYGAMMCLFEILADSENFEIDFRDVGRPLIAADLGIDDELFDSIIEYACAINLLQTKYDGSVLHCDMLTQSFAELTEKRVKRIEAGKRGAEARWASRGDNTPAKANPPKQAPKPTLGQEVKTKAPAASLEERREKFRNAVFEFEGKYPAPLLQAFFNYWAESNEDGRSMKWEITKRRGGTFNISARLATWAQKEQDAKDNNNTRNYVRRNDAGLDPRFNFSATDQGVNAERYPDTI